MYLFALKLLSFLIQLIPQGELECYKLCKKFGLLLLLGNTSKYSKSFSMFLLSGMLLILFEAGKLPSLVLLNLLYKFFCLTLYFYKFLFC